MGRSTEVRGGGGASTGRDTRDHSGFSGGGTGQGGFGQGGRGGTSATPRGGGGASTGRDNRAYSKDRPSPGQGGAGGGTFVGGAGQTRDTMQEQDRIGANVANAQNDYNNQGNGLADTIGNFIASMFGFNEMDPTQPGYSGPGRPGQTGQADWGFDPAGLAGGMVGNALGVPVVGGIIADQISSALGRPLEVNLGPSVFAGDGETTVSGPSMTARDGATGEYFGAPPQTVGFANGVSNVAPTRSTFYGSDGGTAEPAPTPEQPPMELPDGLSPTEVPTGVNVDPGNSGLTESQLASIFQQYGNKVYKGKNRSTVVS